MELKLSKKLVTRENKSLPRKAQRSKKAGIKELWGQTWNQNEKSRLSGWNYLVIFLLFIGIFTILIFQLSNLQITEGSEMLAKSENNQIAVENVVADRGVIFDSNGVKLVENVASSSLYLTLEGYLNDDGSMNEGLLTQTSNTLGGILGKNWKRESDDGTLTYSSISDRIVKVHEANSYFTDILIASDLDNETIIKIKAHLEDLPGVYISEGSKRSYPFKNVLSAILGYTGEVTSEDLADSNDLNSTDIVGRTGLERQYNEELSGTDGKVAWEVDNLGRRVSDTGLTLQEAISGDNLYLTIDLETQTQLYKYLKEGIKDSGATGGAAIIEDVTTGEIVAMVTYPTYDNNLFIGGISVSDYSNLVSNSANPLMNRAIAAQVPAGSTFKTIVAVSALDAGALTEYTKYTSTSNYKFSNGASFQEYHNHAYGTLNVVDALMVSSNIFFCETIRHWDMDKLVPYLEKFGIGSVTGVDLPGEMSGRVPSPANKLLLATTTSPWLDPVWYPEGDSCNSVIGQGITLITPIQMSNWMAAIANEGTLYKPHLAKYFVDAEGNKTEVPIETLQTKIAGKEAFNITKEGMWSAVNGSRASISSLANLGVEVAAKTGTAEFGALDEEGNYEHTHAWVGGFFPYDNPKYSFTVFLEDGGESLNAVKVMQNMIKWMVKEGKI